MSKSDKAKNLATKLITASCNAMCDNDVWSRKNHRLVVDCIDLHQELVRGTQKPKGHTVTHFS